jgi:hypothetical protein
MNLVDLRLPKKSEKELKKTMEVDQPKYPYGFQLRFDSEQIAKLPQLEKVKIGEKVTVNAIGEVVEVRKVDRQKEDNQFSVEIQLKQIGVQGSSPKKDESLIGAIEKAKKGQLK